MRSKVKCFYVIIRSLNPLHSNPDSKVHGANMGPSWVLSAPDGPHVGPMNIVIKDILVKCGIINCLFINSWRRHDIETLSISLNIHLRKDQIRSNSNFAWNSYRCAFEDSRPIITKFGTRHGSRTVVTCTKFRYDRPTIIEIRGTRIFSKFWIRSNLSIRYLVGQAPVMWNFDMVVVFIRQQLLDK